MKLSEALVYATDTKHVVTGEVVEESGELYKKHFGGLPAFLVADENTYGAAGAAAVSSFRKAGVDLEESFIFQAFPHLSCEYKNAQTLRKIVERRNAIPVAVGSGTVNDLVKTAAFESGVRYMNIATAASVDGYTSPGASVIKDGFKTTIQCKAPLVIVADSEVLRSAPTAMSAAGYADLAGKYTAGVDWIIADVVGVDQIDKVAWRMVHEDLESRLEDPFGVAAGRKNALENLFTGLTMTGLAMQYLQRSRPASGLEHAMSHIWEMEGLSIDEEPVSHGFKVAIGTLASTALIETILRRNPGRLKESATAGWRPFSEIEGEIRKAFDHPLMDAVIAESKAKHLSREAHVIRVDAIVECWEKIRREVSRRLPSYLYLKETLSAAGAPVTPEEIGISKSHLVQTFKKASYIRSRYTNIDLAIDLGMLDECVDDVAASGTYLE